MRVRSQHIADTLAHFRNVLFLGLLVAASYGLYYLGLVSGRPDYSLGDWFRDGCVLGLGTLLSGWAFQVFLNRTPKEWVPVRNTHPGLRGRLATWMNTIGPLHIWQAALLFGVGVGLSYMLSQWLSLSYMLSQVLSYTLSYTLFYGLIYVLNVSIIVVLVRAILVGAIGSLRFAERIRWTWRGLLRREHLRTSQIISGTLFLFYGLFYGLFYELRVGLSDILTVGLSDALNIGLCYWMLLGLYQGMKQEHLEDHDRRQFNQGIRRSLRNGLLMSLISALIISFIGGLSNGQRYRLFYGLDIGLHYGLSVGLSLLFPGIVVMWALFGGLTVLRHYVIRWLLARHHTFPWRAQAFLDDATTRILLRRVGGGYSFIHRRLQDYFADAAVPPSQN